MSLYHLNYHTGSCVCEITDQPKKPYQLFNSMVNSFSLCALFAPPTMSLVPQRKILFHFIVFLFSRYIYDTKIYNFCQYYPRQISRVIMIIKPTIKLIVPTSISFVALASGISSSIHTKIMAPAAKDKAKGRIVPIIFAKP